MYIAIIRVCRCVCICEGAQLCVENDLIRTQNIYIYIDVHLFEI